MQQIDIPGDETIVLALELMSQDLRVKLGQVTRAQVVRSCILTLQKRKTSIPLKQWVSLNAGYLLARSSKRRLTFTPTTTDTDRINEITEYIRSTPSIHAVVKSDHGLGGFPARMIVVMAVLYNAELHNIDQRQDV